MQIFLTEALTFMVCELHAANDSSPSAVWIELHGDAISDKHFDPVQTHLPCEVCQNDITAFELYAKESVGERFFHHSFYNLCFSHNLRDKI